MHKDILQNTIDTIGQEVAYHVQQLQNLMDKINEFLEDIRSEIATQLPPAQLDSVQRYT